MKKALSLLTVSALAVMLLAGCGKPASTSAAPGSAAASTGSSAASGSTVEGYPTEIDMTEDPYTVAIQVVTLPGAEFQGKAEREAAINAITVPAINCKVEIQEVWINEVVNKTSMAVAGNEKIDLVHVATVNSLSSLVGSDILFDMNQDNLLANRGPEIMKLFGELIGAGEVNGQQLAVPAKVFSASSKGIMYNKDLADKYNITVPEKMTLDDLETVLYQLKEADSSVIPYLVGEGNLNLMYWLQSFERFGSEGAYGAILDPDKELKVENIYASETFKDYCLRMYKWKTDGIIPGDPTDTNPAQSYFGAQQLFTQTIDINPGYRSQYDSQNKFGLGYSELVGPRNTNASITEYMWGIASNSERPDKAMDLLNFIYTNAEVANILKYGIEGTNYDFKEGSDKIIVSNNSYSPIFYFAGNTANMHIVDPAKEDFNEQQTAFEASASISPVCFYMFDDSQFQTESSVIYSTILEYLPRLQNGMGGSEEGTIALIDEFVAKLEASGINEVIAANQTQLDAWLAKQA